MNPTRNSSPNDTTSRSVNINRSGSRRVTRSMQRRMEQQQQRETTVTERVAVVFQRHVQPPDPRWTSRRQWNERVLENARGFGGHRMIATQEGFAHRPSLRRQQVLSQRARRMVARFAHFVYKRPDGVQPAERERCPICIEDFSDGIDVVKLDCSHVYHEKCCNDMFKNFNFCCLCKHEYAQ